MKERLKPSDLRAEAQRLVTEGKMPSLSDVVDAIRQVKQNREFEVPVIHDALCVQRQRRSN